MNELRPGIIRDDGAPPDLRLRPTPRGDRPGQRRPCPPPGRSRTRDAILLADNRFTAYLAAQADDEVEIIGRLGTTTLNIA
jgi:hypothetical protein